MKNKKGFAFVETVLALTIVTLSLSLLLATYSLVTRKSREKETYDKPGDKYLLQSILNLIEENNQNFSFDENKKINASNCNSISTEIFGSIQDGVNPCDVLLNNYDIKTLYVVKDVLATLKTPGTTRFFDNGTIEYMKTIKKCNDDNIYIDNQNGSIPTVKDKNSVSACENPVHYLIGVFYRSDKYYFASIPVA